MMSKPFAIASAIARMTERTAIYSNSTRFRSRCSSSSSENGAPISSSSSEPIIVLGGPGMLRCRSQSRSTCIDSSVVLLSRLSRRTPRTGPRLGRAQKSAGRCATLWEPTAPERSESGIRSSIQSSGPTMGNFWDSRARKAVFHPGVATAPHCV